MNVWTFCFRSLRIKMSATPNGLSKIEDGELFLVLYALPN
jgi:hypothetical protein